MKFKKIASLTLSIAMVAAMATTNISALNTEDNSMVVCSKTFTREEYYKQNLNENDLIYYPHVEANHDFRPKDLRGIMINHVTNYPTVQEANGEYHNYVDFSHLHIPATNENFDNIVKTYWFFLDDNPRLFNVNGTVAVLSTYNPEKNRWEYSSIREYFWDTDPALIASKEKAFDEKSAEIVKEASKFETDLEKALFVHDNLIFNADYVNNAIKDANGRIIEDRNTHDAYGCIVKGECVCNGYAEAYLHIMQLLGVPTQKVTSYDINHAWDMVYLENNWHYLDTTWDDPGDYATRTGYRYFLKSEEDFNHGGKDWFSGTLKLSGTNYAATYKGETFWENTTCMMPYADGNWYCHTQDKTGIQSYDVSTGKYKDIVTGEDLVWDREYINNNYSNMFIADGRLYYSTETQVKSVKLDGSDKRVDYTLSLNELAAGNIYTLVQEGNKGKIEIKDRSYNDVAKTSYFDLNSSSKPAPEPNPNPNPNPDPDPVPSEYDAWDSSKAYTGGSIVSYNGKNYKAKWWTQGNVPSNSDVWAEISSTTPKPDPEPTPDPDPKPDPKPNPTPNPDPNPNPNPVKYEEWKSSKAYGGGSKVSYNGKNYKAKWWTQGNKPSTSDVWVEF